MFSDILSQNNEVHRFATGAMDTRNCVLNPNNCAVVFDVSLLNNEAVDFTSAKFRGGLLDLQQVRRVANAT
ncbi:MAG TPA: hypothetical protein VFO86_11210, partial [Terriglobia bacterium]|nr:hypothetical protein [Terriglobia bacterium]